MDGPGTVAGHDDGVQGCTYLDGVLAWLQKAAHSTVVCDDDGDDVQCEPRGEGLSSVEDVYEGGTGRCGAHP